MVNNSPPLKCFEYLLLNKCEITEKTLKYSITGGCQAIIALTQQSGCSFEEFLKKQASHITDMNSQIG